MYLKTSLNRWGEGKSIPPFIIQPIQDNQVVKMLKEMKSGHAFGHDGIDIHSLKIVAESIFPQSNIL